MQQVKKPSLLTGALVGLLLTAPLLALIFLGSRLVGLPLVPLDFFDWLVPILPGDVITFGIDVMVDAIIAAGYGQDVDTVAKTLEQGMAYVFILGLGVVLGAVFFALAPRFGNRVYFAGAVVGGVVGLAFTAISLDNGVFDTSGAAAGAWVLALFTAWGVAFGWLFNDLSEMPLEPGKAKGKPKNDEAEPAPVPAANVQQIGRREFLVRVGGATATLTLVGAGLGLALGEGSADATTVASGAGAEDGTVATGSTADQLPNANADVQPAPGMRPEYTPVEDHYRIDIATRPIEIDAETWVLPFTGLVAENRAFTMQELRALPARDEYITMQCISNRLGGNLISTTRWTGTPVREVLQQLEIEPSGKWLRIQGGDDFFEYLSIDMAMEDERIMFTYDFDGEPLPVRNGFPLRVYIPERYGMKQPKWITNIEVVEEDERGYWVRRGWSADAIMQTTSIVDTVATNDIYQDEDGNWRVPVGGFAMSSIRGISKVELSINDGDWIEADLRDPISDKTWVFWRYDWAFEEGEHAFRVRTYDADGTLQPTERAEVRPDGATGVHTAVADLTIPEAESETAS